MSASNSELRAHGITAAHAALAKAAATRSACEPVRPLIEQFGIAGAYEVQDRGTADAVKAGRRVVGAKIGITSHAVQRQLGVDQPDFGVLFDDMEFGDDQPVPLSRLIQPRIEAEIAFVLDRDLDAERPTLAQVMIALGYVLPAIEIVDSRVRDWNITIIDTIADNGSSGLFILGGAPRKLDALDLRLCGMRLENRGELLSTGCGAACLGNPLNAVVWLARALAARGQPLRAGAIVLSGALGPMAPVKAGEIYEARIAGLGRVSAAFTGE